MCIRDRASPIRFGLVTVEKRGLKPRELTLEDIPAGKVKDYLLASAACFPALRAKQIDGVQFLDGGYRDNMPTALAQKMGAEELVCVDLEGVGITLPNRTGLPTTMIRSYWELGDILHFDPDTARRKDVYKRQAGELHSARSDGTIGHSDPRRRTFFRQIDGRKKAFYYEHEHGS